jgi:S-DNA-T family DNA segregation ATPase FtsK/SpoIIIE
VCFIDEAQNLFMHPVYGEQAQDDAAYVIRLGRAYGVILVLATQRPDSKTMPTSVTGNIVCRFCLQVPGQVENDIILGTSSYRNGYNAAVFRPKTDAGLGWLKADGPPQIVRTYKVDLEPAEKVCARARDMRERAGRLTGYALGELDTAESRDVLADVLAVFAGPGMHWDELADRLAARWPARWADVTGEALSAQLRAKGVPSVMVSVGGSKARGCRRVAVERESSR